MIRCVVACACVLMGGVMGEETTLYDFTKGTHGWRGNAQVAELASTAQGLVFSCTGEVDPWIEGPPITQDIQGGGIRLVLRIRTDGDTGGELFYGPVFRAGDSVSVELKNDGKWHDYRVTIPPQPQGTRLRLDPGNKGGDHVVVQSIKATVLVPVMPLPLDPPVASVCNGPSVSSRALSVRHSPDRWGVFEVIVDGVPMARGHGQDTVGYMSATKGSYLGLADVACKVTRADDDVRCLVSRRDSDGAQWQLVRTFRPDGSGAIRVNTQVTVDRDRTYFHIPWVTLFPGFGTFGSAKTQALLPGIEYLADEPSSSEADIKGGGAIRRIPDDMKFCFPMMALVAQERYLALTWNRTDHPAALFDSPDRLFNSGAQVMGLWSPGIGDVREENELECIDGLEIKAGVPLNFSYVLLAGTGRTAIDAVRHFVTRRGLPELPVYSGGFGAAVTLLTHGWLESAANREGKWRHAVWGDRFGPQAAADAVCFMRWLATNTNRPAAGEELRAAAKTGLATLDGNLDTGVSHVRFPLLPYLLYGGVDGKAKRAGDAARKALSRFEADGSLTYRPREGKPDYSSTHFARHANGLGAPIVASILEACMLNVDVDLRERALELVDKQTALYAGTVPRGAQTWECALHTPDILASARMVRMYVLAYLISGAERHLEEARYWAWTGVPFVYLDDPVQKPVGRYATIAVLGATNWRAPCWIGRPVQWCGLVYRSSLVDLAGVDPERAEFWRKLAAGITISGLQQSFGLDDSERQGLLPDYYFPRTQRGDGPAINPGTVEAHLAEAYGRDSIFSVRRVGTEGVLVHAPGTIVPTSGNSVSIRAWPRTPYRVLVTGIGPGSRLYWDGDTPDVRILPESGAAVVTVEGSGSLSWIAK